MAVTVTRNFGPLDQIDLITRGDWGKVGRLARERIIRRTQQGHDQEDASFKPYSADYLAQRHDAGLGDRVDLQVSGAMLQAIQVEPDDQGVTLTIR